MKNWKPGIYDAIDMGHAYGVGYWSGAIATGLVMLGAFALIGFLTL